MAKQPNYRQVVISAQMPNNPPIPKLTAADLSLYQNNKQIPIALFQQLPTTVGILVDTSGSMEKKLAICRSAITSFVNDLDSRDDLFLFAFSNRAYLLAEPTTDHAALLRNLSRLYAFGKTAIYDSINEGLSMLSKGCYPSKALFLITDGMDTSSSNHLETIVARASKAKVPIYSVGIGNPGATGTFLTFQVSNESEAVDTKALSTLANDTGGETFLVTLADKGEALKQAVSAIADKINNQYIVGFIGDGSANQLRLETANYKGIKLKVLTED